jgi:phosphoglucomutase
VPSLLAAEMTALSGSDPGELYGRLTERFGAPVYTRLDVPATPEEKQALGRLSGENVRAAELAGEPVLDVITVAPGNGQPIGGVKVVSEHGWFAARPSGTEDVYKVYAESFLGAEHLERILDDAKSVVRGALETVRQPSSTAPSSIRS